MSREDLVRKAAEPGSDEAVKRLGVLAHGAVAPISVPLVPAKAGTQFLVPGFPLARE